MLIHSNVIAAYQVETAVNDPERGVSIRRQLLGSAGGFASALEDVPYTGYDYNKVYRP